MRIAAAAIVGLVLVGGADAARRPTTFENRAVGYTIALPAGWQARGNPADGATTLSTYRVRDLADMSARPPRGGVRTWLFDYGPDSGIRAGALPATLSPVRPYEVVGRARNILFRVRGHVFQAAIVGAARPEVLTILASIRLTHYSHSLVAAVSSRVLGRSVEERPIRAWRVGNPSGRTRVLVVGCIHGDECAGLAVTQRLVRLPQPTTVDLWIVPDLNPDGHAHGTRQNADGVDLNRNFGAMWRPIGRRGDRQYAGPRPWSEPETRIAHELLRRLRPDVTIWFHQPQGLVRAWGRSIPLARRYARLAGVPYRSLPWPNGTAANWQNHAGLISFVVELPPGGLADADADRYADAVLDLAR